MEITYLKHAEINKVKWDECILKSSNGNIYSTAVFLDNMTESWDAIVLADYEAVLPLPFRKKFFIWYIYPPAFSQQMGISYLPNHAHEGMLSDLFFNTIPEKFKYVEMNFSIEHSTEILRLQKRKNFLLDLSGSFGETEKYFKRSALRNIKKAVSNNISISENTDPAEILQMHRKRFEDKIGVKAADYENLIILTGLLIKTGNAFTLGALDNQGQLIAGSIYFLYKNRLTFIFNGNSEEALELGATHLLLEYTIKKFSGKNIILDFEGSDNAAFARFYEQYGAVEEEYVLGRLNRLPWPFNILKNNQAAILPRSGIKLFL